jgi:uncharacterized protein VirK/YbjX
LWSAQNITNIADAGERLEEQRCRMIRFIFRSIFFFIAKFSIKDFLNQQNQIFINSIFQRRGIKAEPFNGSGYCDYEVTS